MLNFNGFQIKMVLDQFDLYCIMSQLHHHNSETLKITGQTSLSSFGDEIILS